MRIAIIGLLPRQKETVRSKFPGADLRFIETASRSPMCQANYVVVMTKFFNHSRGLELLQGIGRGRTILVRGGMTVLTQELTRLTNM